MEKPKAPNSQHSTKEVGMMQPNLKATIKKTAYIRKRTDTNISRTE